MVDAADKLEGEKPKPEPKPKTGRCVKKSWIQEYLKYTAGQESPELFHLWTAITILAGVVRRNVWLKFGGGKIIPNFYTVLVSPTGVCRKQAAIDEGTNMLREVGNLKILHEKVTPEGLISYLRFESTKKIEVEGKLVIDEECVVFIQSSELANFIGSTQYSEQLRELMTGLWDNHKDWDYTTQSRGKEPLRNINVNFLGASNPEWLAKGFKEDSFGGGFIGRIIFIFQNRRIKVAWPKKTPEQMSLRNLLVMDLQHISTLHGSFKVTDKARDFFEDWYMAFEPDMSGRMVGYLQRKHVHMLKLAMLLSVAENDELIMREGHVKAAKVFLEQIEDLMPQAFAFVGATNEAKIAQRIIEMIASNNGLVSQRILLNEIRRMIRSKREFDGIIEVLVESGIILFAKKDNVLYYFLTDEYLAGKLGQIKRKSPATIKKKKKN